MRAASNRERPMMARVRYMEHKNRHRTNNTLCSKVIKPAILVYGLKIFQIFVYFVFAFEDNTTIDVSGESNITCPQVGSRGI